MRNKLIILFSLCLNVAVFAQETPVAFSLQEAIDYALIHNRTVKNAARDIEIAEEQKWETTATGLPQISANVDYQNWIKQQVSLLPGEIAGGPAGTFIPVEFSPKQNIGAMATLNQLLFDGSYIVGLQAAKVYLEISENSKVKTDLEVRKAVINAYGNVLLTEESLQILESNKAILESNLDEIQKTFENGLEEEESVEQIKITLSGLISDLNNVKRLNVLSYQMLNITLGIDLNTDTTLTDDLEVLALQYTSLEALAADESVENTIDYRIAENDVETKDLFVKLAMSDGMPTLSAFVNGGYSAFGEDFGFFNNNQKWYGSSMFGVNLSIPIFSSLGRSAATQQARIDLEIANENLIDTEQQLKFQIATAKSEYQYAIEDYSNKKENLELAERIERKNETKFFEGISSSFDLRQAQTQLYSAQQEYLQSMLDIINKKAELDAILSNLNN
ncbi:outer membrane efflux protein [Formosa agariphila KMM 3901]|uniref:Outer membrane efflux protein n=1 Tax=Formosa agariphila (strain DSM 15362 / KCTC 12365 / LMG 23005 / KMM 3901 / M-2Alg 35-1) TaxID=1347342 RepID=T2KHK9_FORAG|nr:TolC family protein [Formosa agariphila]CDF77883.1 outer membrane efflux protein [Formosa agariphila KMM 3901]